MEQAVSLESACLHCGTTYFSTSSSQFCCAGCEFVYGLIQDQGLNRYYEIRNANPPSCPVPAQVSSSSYDYCDDEELIHRFSPDGLHLKFFIEGVNCTACLWLLEKLPQFCSDAVSSVIDMSASTIEVERKAEGSFAAIAKTLDRFGYKPHLLRFDESANRHQISERRRDLVRIGVAAAATGNIMILAVSLYGGAEGALAEQFRWLSSLIATPVLTFCAWPFYRSTIAAFRSRHINIDVPIVFAILAGIIASAWSLATSKGDVYFDSLSMLVLLLLSSRFFLKAVQNQQFQATNLENELLTGSVKRVSTDGTAQSVSALSLVVNDVIQIDGETIVPADGRVIFGEGKISRAVLTGESDAIAIAKDSWVEAGTRNISGLWHLKIEKAPGQTRLSSILRETEKAAQAKTAFTRFADRIGQAFVMIVFAVAAIVLLHFLSASPAEGFSRALALIIVTCPCVFGIAIPLSMTFAVREAARKGIVVKNADAIERLWNVTNAFFDKTGTLTTGEMAVVNVQSDDRSKLGYALGLERDERHPVARAITRYLNQNCIEALSIQKSGSILKGGVEGIANGLRYSVAPMPGNSSSSSSRLLSSVGLFENNSCIAKFELGDDIRQEAGKVIQSLGSQGIRSQIISGDRSVVVNSCARKLGLLPSQIHAELTPEQKVEMVRRFPEKSLMIGDGANDAAALAAASVGIAVCGSLDVSLKAADVYLARPNLSAVPELVSIALRTKRAIKRNLIFSASFNVFSGTLAVLGLMTPLWAAVLMPLSSLIILASATWTGRNLSRAGESK